MLINQFVLNLTIDWGKKCENPYMELQETGGWFISYRYIYYVINKK